MIMKNQFERKCPSHPPKAVRKLTDFFPSRKPNSLFKIQYQEKKYIMLKLLMIFKNNQFNTLRTRMGFNFKRLTIKNRFFFFLYISYTIYTERKKEAPKYYYYYLPYSVWCEWK